MKILVGFILGILAYIIQMIELGIVFTITIIALLWFGEILGYENILASFGSFIKQGSASGIGFALFAVIFFVFWIIKAEKRVAKFHNDIVDNIKSKIFKD